MLLLKGYSCVNTGVAGRPSTVRESLCFVAWSGTIAIASQPGGDSNRAAEVTDAIAFPALATTSFDVS